MGIDKLDGALRRRAGGAWDRHAMRRAAGANRNWWDSPRLSAYVRERVSAAHETGVVGALRARLEGRALGRGVSVGCGDGRKELALVSAGLVEAFDLYEVSESFAERARAEARKLGFDDRVQVHRADVFARAHDGFDLVYWDHALHHMMEVAEAVAWSVRVLKPGGLLMINDYVGPTRLQWPREQVRFARAYLAEAEAMLGRELPKIRFKTPVSRLRMRIKDPSEAPQSDRIVRACRRHCDGFAPTAIGCAMINICGPSLANGAPEDGPAHDLLIEWDRKAETRGMAHFAFGLWRKAA